MTRREVPEAWRLDGTRKCPMCNYFPANLWLFDNNTAYPNCGDQTCMSAFMWDHPGLLDRLMAEDAALQQETEPEPPRELR